MLIQRTLGENRGVDGSAHKVWPASHATLIQGQNSVTKASRLL